MNPVDLIAKLKAQHRVLQADLASAWEDHDTHAAVASSLAVASLEKFRADILEHLALENDTFYPDFFEKKKKMGLDVQDTEQFVAQMSSIGAAVMAFLDKYKTTEAIDKAPLVFKKELLDISSTLNVRIETEEEGVFDFYLAMK